MGLAIPGTSEKAYHSDKVILAAARRIIAGQKVTQRLGQPEQSTAANFASWHSSGMPPNTEMQQIYHMVR